MDVATVVVIELEFGFEEVMVVVVATPQLEFSSPEVESVSADGLDKSYTGLLKLRAETGGI